MRVFFIIFIFISVIAVYPKIISLYTGLNLPVSASDSSIMVESKKIYRKIQYLTEDDEASPLVIPPKSYKQINTNLAGVVKRKHTSNNAISKDGIVALRSTNKSKYKNGEYKGSTANAYYGYVQVKAIVKSGKISDIKILKSPNNSRNSVYLNSQALPYLKREIIEKQRGSVDVVSGATYTSMAFMESAKSALLKAIN